MLVRCTLIYSMVPHQMEISYSSMVRASFGYLSVTEVSWDLLVASNEQSNDLNEVNDSFLHQPFRANQLTTNTSDSSSIPNYYILSDNLSCIGDLSYLPDHNADADSSLIEPSSDRTLSYLSYTSTLLVSLDCVNNIISNDPSNVIICDLVTVSAAILQLDTFINWSDNYAVPSISFQCLVTEAVSYNSPQLFVIQLCVPATILQLDTSIINWSSNQVLVGYRSATVVSIDIVVPDLMVVTDMFTPHLIVSIDLLVLNLIRAIVYIHLFAASNLSKTIVSDYLPAICVGSPIITIDAFESSYSQITTSIAIKIPLIQGISKHQYSALFPGFYESILSSNFHIEYLSSCENSIIRSDLTRANVLSYIAEDPANTIDSSLKDPLIAVELFLDGNQSRIPIAYSTNDHSSTIGDDVSPGPPVVESRIPIAYSTDDHSSTIGDDVSSGPPVVESRISDYSTNDHSSTIGDDVSSGSPVVESFISIAYSTDDHSSTIGDDVSPGPPVVESRIPIAYSTNDHSSTIGDDVSPGPPVVESRIPIAYSTDDHSSTIGDDVSPGPPVIESSLPFDYSIDDHSSYVGGALDSSFLPTIRYQDSVQRSHFDPTFRAVPISVPMFWYLGYILMGNALIANFNISGVLLYK